MTDWLTDCSISAFVPRCVKFSASGINNKRLRSASATTYSYSQCGQGPQGRSVDKNTGRRHRSMLDSCGSRGTCRGGHTRQNGSERKTERSTDARGSTDAGCILPLCRPLCVGVCGAHPARVLSWVPGDVVLLSTEVHLSPADLREPLAHFAPSVMTSRRAPMRNR